MSQDDTKTKILVAAGPVFADKGYQAATVREICQLADVNLASVNYYFGDKQQLYDEAVRTAHQLCIAQVPMPDWPANASAEIKLAGFIRTMYTRMVGSQSAPWQTRLMMREVLDPTETCRQMVDDYFRPHFAMLLDILRELLGDDLPLHRLQQIGFSVVGQCLYYRVAGDVVTMMVGDAQRKEHFTIGQVAEHITQLTLSALCPGRSLAADVASAQPTTDLP
jgi:AcrR family transcriptional regulator